MRAADPRIGSSASLSGSDEDHPPRRGDRGGGRDHVAPVHVARDHVRLGHRRGPGPPRRLHLRQAGEVGVAQHAADVGMRDQPALRVHHIGIAGAADLDLRHHVPDELEVDLGDADARVAPVAGDRQGHVGLGIAAEGDRPVVDAPRHGLGELRLARQVGLAADHVHREARHAQLLAALGVELRELGHRRHLAQQAQRVEPPLLDAARRPRQLGGPAELALDLVHELADADRRGLRLLALDADQVGLAFLVGEPDLQAAARDQRGADHGHEQADILAEQPPADPGRLSHRCHAG